MSSRTAKAPVDLSRAILEAWAVTAEVTRYLLETLDGTIWRADPPGGEGRTIASSFAHIHNVRRMLLVMSKVKGAPAKLDRHRATREQARASLEKSADGIARVLEAALALSSGGRVRGIGRDAAAFLASAVAHEAHVRGQICSAARRLGSPLSPKEQLETWEWEKRRKAVATLTSRTTAAAARRRERRSLR